MVGQFGSPFALVHGPEAHKVQDALTVAVGRSQHQPSADQHDDPYEEWLGAMFWFTPNMAPSCYSGENYYRPANWGPIA